MVSHFFARTLQNPPTLGDLIPFGTRWKMRGRLLRLGRDIESSKSRGLVMRFVDAIRPGRSARKGSF